MLVYIEYISRRSGIGLHEFHTVVGGGQTGWSGDYSEDAAILNLGRSWRMGPEPEYMCVWYTPDAGMERIDEWERVFRSGVADAYEEPFRLAGRIDRAGCYEPLLEPVRGSMGRYYAEWFDLAPGASREGVIESVRSPPGGASRSRAQPGRGSDRQAGTGPTGPRGVGRPVVGRRH